MQFFSLVLHDIKSRYAGSRWGLLWALASPLVTILIYWFVYTIALRGNDLEGVPYLHFLIAGILPWFFFTDGLSGSATVYRDYRFSVCNLPYPLERFPMMRVTASFLIHLVLMLSGILILALTGANFCYSQCLVLFWMVGGFLFTLALGRIFALLGACFKDVSFGLNVVLQLGFWLTPVFWSSTGLPEGLRSLVAWNPAAILVNGYRQALLYGKIPDSSALLIFLGEVLVFYLASCLMMKKIKPTLADRL